jgi:hypothetical protein
MPDAITATPSQDVTLGRLEDQRKWYSARNRRAQRLYKWIKGIEIVAAALIPFFSGLKFPAFRIRGGSVGGADHDS